MIALRARSSRKLLKERTFTANFEVVHYFMEIYATDDVIAEPDADVMRFNSRHNRTHIQHPELFWATALLCDRMYVENVLKRNLL